MSQSKRRQASRRPGVAPMEQQGMAVVERSAAPLASLRRRHRVRLGAPAFERRCHSSGAPGAYLCSVCPAAELCSALQGRGNRFHPWRDDMGFGSSGPAGPAPRSARCVRRRREAVPRKRLRLTLGRAFGLAADGDRPSSVLLQLSLPSMARRYGFRIVRPGHPWPGVRASSRCREGIVVLLRLSMPSMAWRYGLRIAQPGHPWPGVRSRSRWR
jgi:hypothetical protein